jgi:hypothetical protein
VLGLGRYPLLYCLWGEPLLFSFPFLLSMVADGAFFCLQCLPLLASHRLTPELRASETRMSRMARPFGPSLIVASVCLELEGRIWQGMDRECVCVWFQRGEEGFK